MDEKIKLLLLPGLCFLLLCTPGIWAQESGIGPEQELIGLSNQKWRWMADKNVDTLSDLFHKNAVFVHMGGTMSKEQELNVIKTGGIWYKEAEVHEVNLHIIDNTAILLSRITLLAVVGGREVTNPFVVTEVYIKNDINWKLGSMSFTKLLTPD